MMQEPDAISKWRFHRSMLSTDGPVISLLKDKSATWWVIFFLSIYHINTQFVPLAAIAGFATCCFLYYRELYHFIVNNKIVVLYLFVALLSAAWSIVPSLSLWYGCQLCLTALTAILMGISAAPRQIVRGTYVAMAIVIIGSIISQRHGPSAAGPVLIGLTGSKTVIGMAAVALLGSGIAVLFDRQQPVIYRLSTLVLIPIGAYLATHVEAATAKVCAIVFPVAFFGFLALGYLSFAGRWALIGLFLLLAMPLSISFAFSDLSRDADQKILRALNKDVTLTGRTLLWKKADEWIEESPAVGHGFRAFWTSGSSDSLGMLHFNRLIDPRGFQLHNTIKEIRVDTGWLGLIAFLSVVAVFLYNVLSFVFLYPNPASAFLATMYLMTLSLASINTIVGVFTPTTAFFYMCGTAAIVFSINRSSQISSATGNARRRVAHWWRRPTVKSNLVLSRPAAKFDSTT